MLAIIGAKTVAHSFTKMVGIGSNSQDFGDMLRRSFSISAGVVDSNDNKDALVFKGG